MEELGDFFWEQLGGVFLESARRRLSWGSWVTFCLEQLGDVFLVAAGFFLEQLGCVFLGAAGLCLSLHSLGVVFS